MSTLQVANLHFESTGNNRLQYTGSNAYNLVAGGTTVATVNTTAVNFPLNLGISSSLTVNGSVGTAGQALFSGGSGENAYWQSIVSLPAGVVIPYAGTSEPAGWLFCFGQNVSRSTYAALFAVIGTTYGAGDGSTTFGLPDLRGRVVAGQDDMGGTSANRLTGLSGGVDGDVLGAAGGAETHTLTTAQLAAHTHTYNNVTGLAGGFSSGSYYYNSVSSATTGSTGSGTQHNNVQPTLILNYIIKE